jgi:hypothetical protein
MAQELGVGGFSTAMVKKIAIVRLVGSKITFEK